MKNEGIRSHGPRSFFVFLSYIGVGPGSKPVPLSEDEMRNLGFKTTGVVVDFEVGDTIVVMSGAWKDTVGVVKTVNESRQSLTINVEMFGRETPVELNFSEVKKM